MSRIFQNICRTFFSTVTAGFSTVTAVFLTVRSRKNFCENSFNISRNVFFRLKIFKKRLCRKDDISGFSEVLQNSSENSLVQNTQTITIAVTIAIVVIIPDTITITCRVTSTLTIALTLNITLSPFHFFLPSLLL